MKKNAFNFYVLRKLYIFISIKYEVIGFTPVYGNYFRPQTHHQNDSVGANLN